MKPKMSERMFAQRGQGLVESLLVLATLLVVLCSLDRTGGLRQLTLAALYESTLVAFSGKGHTSFAESVTKNAIIRNSVESELLGRDSGLFTRGSNTQHMSTQTVGNTQSVLTTISRIHRFSYLYTGAGRAKSNQAVHTSIGNSKRAWQRASIHSERVARQAAARTGPIDTVWRRSAPQFDWLSAWSDLVPRASDSNKK